jgi:hypothetical protein
LQLSTAYPIRIGVSLESKIYRYTSCLGVLTARWDDDIGELDLPIRLRLYVVENSSGGRASGGNCGVSQGGEVVVEVGREAIAFDIHFRLENVRCAAE